MQPPATLPELVDQLGKTYSPFERLKILGRAWSLLRQMTPEQRMIVAAQLGLDHADEVVESIARRSGQQASPALIAMIERAQVKGTPHLPALIADLRDPGRRADRLRQGAKAVLNEAGSSLSGETTPEVPWLPPATAAPVKAPPRSAPAPPPPPVAPPAPEPPAEASTPAAAEAGPPAVVEAPSRPSVQTAPAPDPKQEEAPPAPPVPAPAAPRSAPALRPEPARGLVDPALAGRLAAAPSLTVRFRLLRRHLEETRSMSAAGLGALLETFPDGWARRRALQELLRSGVPASLDDAFALVEVLRSERDLLWCLGTLADSRAIPQADREAFLAAASSPAARRRLERRLGL